MKAIPILLLILLTFSVSVAQSATQISVDGDVIKVGGAAYEAGFSTTDGHITYILDKATHQNISEGDTSLWTITLANDKPIKPGDGAFSYSIDDTSTQLTLTYTGAADVIVTVRPADTLRLQAAVSNHAGVEIRQFSFPSDLSVVQNDIADALLPMMPGALLNSNFFRKGTTYTEQYPGVMFADYEALRSARGKLAVYGQTNGVLQTAILGFVSADTDHTTLTHNYRTWIADGTDWTTPTVIAAVGQDYPATIADFRTLNGIDQYPSLETKLGDAAPAWFAAPMYKLDVQVIQQAFSALKDSVVAKLNFPGIVHFVAFQNGGHDNNYPDFIPPATKWGTTEDFADLVSAVHNEGSLAVPYSNFSWWDNDGPFLKNLPEGATLNDVIVTDAHGLPDFEKYGAHAGFVVDPNTETFKSKVDEQFDALLNTVGMDGIFEDQWGARNAPYDFNPAAGDPATGYFAGALAHYHDHAETPLFTEVGVDALARDATGFMGTNYLWDVLGYRKTAAYTTYYPMAGMLLRDKVLLYQHDLAAETWTKNLDMLRWNLAQGYSLSNAVIDDSGAVNMDNPWLNLIGVFQKYALANYADQLVQSYDDLGNGVTRTTFSTYSVDANWNADQPYTVDGDTLPPGGVITRANDGSVIAGVFSGYNGQPLSDGEHYLLEVHAPDEIRVYQPIGADTPLHLTTDWADVTVEAHGYDGTLIGTVDATVSGNAVQFSYASALNGTPVGYYRVVAK